MKSEFSILNVELPIDVRQALMELHRQKDTPLIAADVFASILKTLSEVVQESVFNFSEISKTVRDAMLKRGVRVGRSYINYVIRGISFSGHRFDPDLPQESVTLAAAFLRSLRKDLQITVPLEGDALVRVLVHCSGELLDRESVGRLLAQPPAPSVVIESFVRPGIDAGGHGADGSESVSARPTEPSAIGQTDEELEDKS
jgi:hypothetical protein